MADAAPVQLTAAAECYPAALRRHLGEKSPAAVAAWGSLDLLRRPLLAFFCSVKCPGDELLATYDLARALRDAGVAVIGGFHSPAEKECLEFLLRGTQPLVICPARSLEGMRLPSAWRPALSAGRLLLLSPFRAADRRATSDLARRRNELVAALSSGLFVAHAAPGSKTEALARQALAWGKPVWALESANNRHLHAVGTRPLTAANAAEAWSRHLASIPTTD